MPEFTEEQVEVVALHAVREVRGVTGKVNKRDRDLIRAALSSDVIGDLIAEALAPVREALEGHALGMQDVDDTLAVIDEAIAALSPTPADGTTSERSEA